MTASAEHTAATRVRDDLRRPMLAGAVGLVALLGLTAGWAAFTVISGAVIAQGQVMVQGKAQQVQSLDGGIIDAISVQNGDRVQEGQVLLRLDSTLLAINLDIAHGRLAGALALKARLEAEQAGLEAPVFDYPDLPFPPLDTARHEQGQRQIFAARADLRHGRQARLVETLQQYENQIAGIEQQIVAKQAQTGYLQQDLDNLRTLSAKGLVRQSQLSDLLRAEADLTGQTAALHSDMARLRNAMREAEIEVLQSERGFLEEVVTGLREVTAQSEELILEIVTRSAQLARIELRAPADGIVHELQTATVGGVVAPGATVLQVVPLDRGVEFELRVDPRTIDQVYPGQKAQLVLSSFDPNAAPKLTGIVTTISPSAVEDPRSGQSYFRIGLSVTPEELARLGSLALVPGMPVEAYLETGERSVLAYLMQPITGHLRRAFREG